MMAKRYFVLALATLFFSSSIFGQENEPDIVASFMKKHQFGARIGAWMNLGETPPASLFNPNTNSLLETNIDPANFYFEGFFGYRLNKMVIMELSLGVSNRGSVTLNEFGTTNVGNVVIYPMLLQLKLYPLTMTGSRLQPFFLAGGGIYYGKRSTQFSTLGFITTLDEETETDFHYSLGGGVDLPLASSIAVGFNVKYMPINFSRTLVAIRDYDAISFTVGVKYLYSFKKGKQKRRGPPHEDRH